MEGIKVIINSNMDRMKDQTIDSVELVDDELRFYFKNKTAFGVFDDGQSCCENRYMVTDDDLSYYGGAVLLDMTLESAPNIPDDEEHEVQFLHVKTSKGSFTISNHNEHNGYYGGFSIRIREV